MEEKRFTLRMNFNVYEISRLMGKANNRSTAKEIEFALMRYYFLLPHIDSLLRNSNIDIKSFYEPLVKSEEMILELHKLIENYNNSSDK